MTPTAYAQFLRIARRFSRHADEAEDLLQTVLLAAHRAGRGDMDDAQNRRWITGALRKRAAFEARTALRRRRREAQTTPHTPSAPSALPDGFLTTLPPALERTARLALSGHSRAEIACLLRVSDPALRQRFHQIRRRWDASQGDAVTDMAGLAGHLPYGLIRRALIAPMRRTEAQLGSHDPDGHLFVLSTAHKTAPHGNG